MLEQTIEEANSTPLQPDHDVLIYINLFASFSCKLIYMMDWQREKHNRRVHEKARSLNNFHRIINKEI